MNELVSGSKTKWMVACDAVAQMLPYIPGKAALRVYGDDCAVRRVVAFTTRTDGLKRALTRVPLNGKAALALGVAKAVEDLTDNSPDVKSASLKRIVVIAGSADGCVPNPTERIGALLDQWRRAGKPLDLDLRMVGLAIPEGQRLALERLCGQYGGTLRLAGTEQQVLAALEEFLVVEPAVHDGREMAELLNRGVAHMNALVDALNGGQEASARFAFDSLRVGLSDSEGLLQDILKRSLSSELRAAGELARMGRDVQKRSVEIGRDMLQRRRANDVEGYNKSVEQWNVSSRLNQALDGLVAHGSPLPTD
jgi:hypothetical protein